MDTEAPKAPPAATTVTVQQSGQKQRRATACVRCNLKRSKCDASVVGLPCTTCRNAKYHECHLIRSKRTRGSRGRFVKPSEIEGRPQILWPESTNTAPSVQQSLVKQSDVLATKTAHDPLLSLDPAILYNDGGSPIESEVRGREAAAVRNETSGGKLSRSRDQKQRRAAFLGENWFASYLAHTAAGHSKNHRHVLLEPNPVMEVSAQNNFTVHQSTNMLYELAAIMDTEYVSDERSDTSTYPQED